MATTKTKNAYPTLSEAESLLNEMRQTIDSQGRPVINVGPKPSVAYLAAAMAIQRNLFSTATGSPKYMAAAAHYADTVNSSSGVSVKNWVIKLEKIQHAKRQVVLAEGVVGLDVMARNSDFHPARPYHIP